MKNLMNRGGVWYYRKHIPAPLRPFLDGKREIWESLFTGDRREAEVRLHSVATKVNDQLAGARRKIEGHVADAAAMASPRIKDALEAFSHASRGLDRPYNFRPAVTPEDTDYVQRALELGWGEKRPESPVAAAALVRQAVEQVDAEREHGWSLMVPAPDDGEPMPVIPARYLDAVTAFVEAQFEATRRTLEALLTVFEAEDRLDAAPASKEPAAVPVAPSERIGALAQVWEGHRKRASSSVLDMRTAVRRFEGVNGPLPWREVTPEHVRAFKADLRGDEALRSATKQKLWSMIHSAMTIAAEDGLRDNPFAGVTLGKLDDDAQEREVLSPADLSLLFANLSGEDWWLARLGLYTGARLGELYQLDKGDLVREAGTLFLYIKRDAAAGKSVKNSNSVRKVPVHEQLLKDGFEQWVANRPEHALFAGEGPAASKRLNRRMRGLGMPDSKVFHSFRHTFKAAAREVMGEEWHDQLTGHAAKNVGRGYGVYAGLKAKIDLVGFGIETA